VPGVRDPNDPCLFCEPRGVTRRNDLAYCARDTYPVSPGHSLVIPLRHCASFFELTREEMMACLDLVVTERSALDEEFQPDGYNVGVNVNRAGGQSIFHVHIHLIPRYAGDHPRPQGGVRQVLLEKANYPRGRKAED
jgi:diadenosine tetraphosphate (Ap4A) HIT family hydrolase